MVEHPSPRTHRLAATLSALVPGMGQAFKRQTKSAALIFLTGILLLLCAWSLRQLAGRGSDVFFLMLVVLPWWVIQAYDAFLPAEDGPSGLRHATRTAWARAHDIRFLGALFLLTAFTDFYIIVANPAYALTVFCTKPAGVLGILAKAQSPTLHILIGYGFLRLRRWSLFLYLIYAAFGLLNATVNYACLGYGRVRTAFLLTLIGFTVYVLWRRDCFRSGPSRL
jgi:hypothetical protein